MPEAASYRAVFRQPRLRPDQLSISIPAPIAVEVFRKTRHKWDAREPRSGNGYNLDACGSAEEAKARIESMFRECVETWTAYDALGQRIEGELTHAS